ncbi:hypothetical protein CA850_32470 [Micromonospora echinospora]|uniref:Phosphoglycolate phosphatase n=1 Tax=Micromonospora echinospora TaxID=1877 RepID=A0A1C4WG19_MICEC|nr:HAD family hydrolase [Micromonospora echinospora]OZV72317.1 hypothetical protein CA850_32470 [Micromonospora echinospora]SCE95130.1 phosphoglycolate phosphatase [Micromonospora echinospora]
MPPFTLPAVAGTCGQDAVLYDLDGVLLDSKNLMTAVITDVTAAVLGSPPSRPAVTSALTMPPPLALHALGVPDPQTAIDTHFDAAYARHAHRATAVPGVVDVLRQLHEAGVAQGIVTLQRRHRLDMLDLSTILPLIDTLVCHDDAPPKPSPAPLRQALTRLGATAVRAWFVGDAATDVTAGRAADIRVAGATWGYHSSAALRDAGATVLLDTPAQIRTLTIGRQEPTTSA